MWQSRWIENGTSLTLGSTDKFDLPPAGDLSTLFIRLLGTPASNLKRDTGGDWRLVEFFPNIVVKVDGTNELCNITARQLSAFHFFDLKVMPQQKLQNYGTGGVDVWLALNFGRYPQDEEVGVQLGDYENPELWITNDAATAQYTGLGIDVVALMRYRGGQGFPRGYMHKKMFKGWTTVHGETEPTNLPTEYALRRLLWEVRPAKDSAYIYKTNIFQLPQTVKLSLRSGQDVFYDGDSEYIARQNHFLLGRYCQTQLAAGFAADVGFHVGIGEVDGRAGVPGPRVGAVASTYTTLEGERHDATQKLEGGGGDDMPQFIFTGLAPEGVSGFLFDSDLEPRTWLDLAVEKQVKLEVTTRMEATGASDDYSDGYIRILLDRLLPHKKTA